MDKELILMNDNAIAALVFLNETENPYEIFCKYITYCLELNKCVAYSELDERIKNNFGLNLPLSLCQKCVDILAADGTVERIEKNHYLQGYKLVAIDYNKDEISQKIKDSKKKERLLLTDMVAYIKKEFDKDWTIDIACRELINFLNYNDAAMYMFLCDNITLDDTSVAIGDDVVLESDNDSLCINSSAKLVQKYLQFLCSQNNENTDYFNDIINGLMLLNGIAYSDNIDYLGNSSIEGVQFFFDTKLVLRYLGFTTQIYKNAIDELIDLIKNKYHGQPCIFKRTVDEVSNALRKVYNQAKHNNIKDLEMSIYYNEEKKKTDYALDKFRWIAQEESLKKALFDEGDFELITDVDWEDTNTWAYNMNSVPLKKFIQSNKPQWNPYSIDVDSDSFIQMNILRHEDYSISYGGKNKLPIFVTSNGALVKCIRQYMKQLNYNDENFDWQNKNLPFISDRQLMCELWLPQFKTNRKASQILQSLLIDAILPYDNMAYNYMREQVKKIRKKENKRLYVNIDKERQEKITTLMLKKNIESFDDFDSNGIVAFCEEAMIAEHIAEIAALKDTIAEQEQQLNIAYKNKENIEQELNDKDKSIKEVKNKLIQTHSEKFLTHIGVARLYIIISKFWWLISTVAIFIVSGGISFAFNRLGQLNVTWAIGIAMLPAVFNLIITIINAATSQKFIISYVNKKCYQYAKKHYIKHIKKNLPTTVNEYQKDILNYCLDNCNILNSIKE